MDSDPPDCGPRPARSIRTPTSGWTSPRCRTPDTVYLTLGTIMNQRPAVFRAVIDGCARWPVNVIVTTGPGFDPSGLGALPPAVRTAPFLPQAAVLPHCRAVVSHAGAGTMLGALCHGLPQLCLPQGTDQPSNTAALLPTGAALALEPDRDHRRRGGRGAGPAPERAVLRRGRPIDSARKSTRCRRPTRSSPNSSAN